MDLAHQLQSLPSSLSTVDATDDPWYYEQSSQNIISPGFTSLPGSSAVSISVASVYALHGEPGYRESPEPIPFVKDELLAPPTLYSGQTPSQESHDIRHVLLDSSGNIGPYLGPECWSQPSESSTDYEEYQSHTWPESAFQTCQPMSADLGDFGRMNDNNLLTEVHARTIIVAFSQEEFWRLGSHVHIQHPFACTRGTKTSIGSGTSIFRECSIKDDAFVLIGNNCTIGPCVTINTAQTYRGPKPVIIEDYCKIGEHAFICGGVIIGAHSIVPDHVTVSKSIPPNSFVMSDGQSYVPRSLGAFSAEENGYEGDQQPDSFVDYECFLKAT